MFNRWRPMYWLIIIWKKILHYVAVEYIIFMVHLVDICKYYFQTVGVSLIVNLAVCTHTQIYLYVFNKTLSLSDWIWQSFLEMLTVFLKFTIFLFFYILSLSLSLFGSLSLTLSTFDSSLSSILFCFTNYFRKPTQ